MILKTAQYGALLLFATLATALGPIDVLFIERSHYIELQNGRPTGPFYERANIAFAAAGIKARWIRTPPLRQFAELNTNKVRICAANWFTTPERRKIAYISAPVIPSSPYLLVARTDDTRFHDDMPLQDLLNTSLRMGLGTGFSLGVDLDKLVTDKQFKVAWERADDSGLLHSLYAGRNDFVFLFANEAPELLRKMQMEKKALRTYTLTGMPDIPWTHLLCAFNIEIETIEKLNASFLEQAKAAE